jgi:hypothetical protein
MRSRVEAASRSSSVKGSGSDCVAMSEREREIERLFESRVESCKREIERMNGMGAMEANKCGVFRMSVRQIRGGNTKGH